MLAEKSKPSQGLFPPTFTRNILTAAVQEQAEQLRAEGAASDTHAEDWGHGPVRGSDKGLQQTRMGAATRESSSEETVTDDGVQDQPNNGMSYHLYELGGFDKPAFTPVNLQRDGNLTSSVPDNSSPPIHLIPIHNVQ